MISLDQLLKPEFTLAGVQGISRKRTFKFICTLLQANYPHIPLHETINDFIQRERLGSTGIGAGVAIPHVKCAHIEQPIAVLMRLKYGIDFDALDSHHVNLILALLIPEHNCTKYEPLLEELLFLFTQKKYIKKLKQAENSRTLYLNALEGVKLIKSTGKQSETST